jgi:hypothetical protein
MVESKTENPESIMRSKIEGHTNTVNSIEIVQGAEAFAGN